MMSWVVAVVVVVVVSVVVGGVCGVVREHDPGASTLSVLCWHTEENKVPCFAVAMSHDTKPYPYYNVQEFGKRTF